MSKDTVVVREAIEIAPEFQKRLSDFLSQAGGAGKSELIGFLWENKVLLLRVVEYCARNSPVSADQAVDRIQEILESELGDVYERCARLIDATSGDKSGDVIRNVFGPIMPMLPDDQPEMGTIAEKISEVDFRYVGMQVGDVIEWKEWPYERHRWTVVGIHLGALGVESLIVIENVTHKPGWTYCVHKTMYVPECLLRGTHVVSRIMK